MGKGETERVASRGRDFDGATAAAAAESTKLFEIAQFETTSDFVENFPGRHVDASTQEAEIVDAVDEGEDAMSAADQQR